MQEISTTNRQEAIARISVIIDKLIQENNLYKEKLNKEEMIHHLVRFIDKFSPEYVKTISDDDLQNRIDSILVIEAVSGTLNDLTPEQMKMYDEAVERRW
ncbi:MAG: hypothetical protein SAL70_29820 [Scytonema sp. PMC 1070.18]|nr:hypothetical protein [Scytonema sp. PMC 1070.18]